MNKQDAADKLDSWWNTKSTKGDTLQLFSEIFKSGLVYELTGCYSFFAMGLIQGGIMDWSGNILSEEV